MGTCILQTTLTYMARLCSYFIRREFLHEIFMDKAFPQLEHFDKMQLILFFLHSDLKHNIIACMHDH